MHRPAPYARISTAQPGTWSAHDMDMQVMDLLAALGSSVADDTESAVGVGPATLLKGEFWRQRHHVAHQRRVFRPELRQRENLQWLAISSAATRMPLRVGVARGAVEFVDGDCYGDAVNVASRLCDLSGPSQIWTSSAAALDSTQHVGLQFRPLGQIAVRGRTKPCAVFQLDWQDEAHTDFMVMQATIQPDHQFPEPTAPGREIELSWIDQQLRFSSSQLPVHIGRDRQAQFVVSDPRVSRAHARIDWRNGSMVLVDLSSYGCWVRYAGSSADLPLRREECLLHGSGEVALGAPFADPSAATLSFRVR